MSQTQEIRTVVSWETSKVDTGLQRVERAIARMGAAEEKAARASDARQAQQARRELQNRERALRDLERVEKDSLERRHRETERAYARADKSEQLRRAAMVAQLRRQVDSSMISPRGAAGGHGGAGFGRIRMAGDLINAATGESGWVSRLGMFSHLGWRIGGGLGAAGAAAMLLHKHSGDVSEQEKKVGEHNLDFARLNRATMFGGRELGADVISDRMEELKKAMQERMATQGELLRLQGLESGWTGAPKRWWKSGVSFFTGARSTGELLTDVNAEIGIAGSRREQLRRERAAAYTGETELARERFTGSEFEARKKEANISEAREITAANKTEAQHEISKIQAKFKIQREAIDAEARAYKINHDAEEEIANLRGSTEERTLRGLEIQARANDRLLANASNLTAEMREQLHIRGAQIEQAKELEERQQAIRRIDRSAAVASGALSVGAASMRMGLAGQLYGSNQNLRFTAGQTAARFELASGVAGAGDALAEARGRLAQNPTDEDLKNAVRLAEQNAVKAAHQEGEGEARLRLESNQRTRQLRADLDARRNETAAMRLSNVGRGDLATVRRMRDTSSASALEAARAGNEPMAREIMAAEAEEEVGLYGGRYLRPDGKRRRRSEVNREFRHARQAQQRFERANSRLRDNLGLIDVKRDMSGNIIGGKDPLTRESVRPDQIYDRRESPLKQAANERMSDNAALTDIAQHTGRTVELLFDRLPKAST